MSRVVRARFEFGLAGLAQPGGQSGLQSAGAAGLAMLAGQQHRQATRAAGAQQDFENQLAMAKLAKPLGPQSSIGKLYADQPRIPPDAFDARVQKLTAPPNSQIPTVQMFFDEATGRQYKAQSL